MNCGARNAARDLERASDCLIQQSHKVVSMQTNLPVATGFYISLAKQAAKSQHDTRKLAFDFASNVSSQSWINSIDQLIVALLCWQPLLV